MIAALLAAAAVAAPPSTGPLDFVPAWSPDRTEVAFIRGYLHRALYVVRPDGTGLRRLASAPQSSPRAPTWSPDSRWIAFSTDDLRGRYRLMVVRRDGSDLQDLGPGFSPAWSPDGREIAFDWHGNLYLKSFPRGKRRLLASFANSPPTWSPDGTRIASAWNNIVFMVDLRTNVRTMVGGGWLPSWSPDGETIAVIQSCAPVFVAVGTLGPPGLTDCGFPVGDDGPVRWSPDGTRIAYGICFSGFCSLEIQRVGASRPFVDMRGAEEASWSPDGKRLVYVRQTVHVMPGTGYAATTYELFVSSDGGPGEPLLRGG